MELNIKNFASIKEASIKIDGITVIAGENNTGKSTIGKILFASFNSLRDIDKEVRLNILNSINRQWDNFVLDLITMHKTDMDISILYDILSNILNVEDEDIEKIISNNVGEYIDINDKFIIEAIKSTANRIKEYKNISKEKLSYNIISKYYNDLFYKQINSRIFKNTNAEIKLNDFGILLEFKDDKCIKFKKNIYDNNVFLIDNPFVLDKIYSSYSSSITDLYLIDKIRHIYNKDYIVDKTLVEEKLEIIYKMLSNAINGKIINKDNDFYLAFDNITEPISIHNISAGLKSFTIIKMMLEEGILKEKDILVLDEPEIHLHPKWQLLYAEIIVLIQKVFNLHIVITTHSPYFLESIELFTKKHGIDDKTNYYLSDINIKENYSTINLVNDRISDIYYKMATPIEDLIDALGDN
ncbi:ATP-binding protein [Brachyspira aalborgi]|jgi:predicted ATP-dependent endonuclease of OLD family|uniref:ATP-binding protein n=2 Tax=Brachyspira aalborgi TaxID=29522 RepID=A0AB38Q4I1_9SPIR|nr:AAA family ATPase [Brachyspira aalborgi]TXJ16659.1 ATP-binding protein [Brachyspira aalborgi]TXJ22820.1 ATP-binding protein [Brachyspira aalborgi]TXJ28680.1 ATP-binding protein [Brachyspira aalborgi]TXJ50527.1 ATP-binding protein [Brachyspira aalborgi]